MLNETGIREVNTDQMFKETVKVIFETTLKKKKLVESLEPFQKEFSEVFIDGCQEVYLMEFLGDLWQINIQNT